MQTRENINVDLFFRKYRMEVVDEICRVIVPVDSNGTVAEGDQPVIEKIEMIEK